MNVFSILVVASVFVACNQSIDTPAESPYKEPFLSAEGTVPVFVHSGLGFHEPEEIRNVNSDNMLDLQVASLRDVHL